MMKHLACGMAQTLCKIDMFIISDQLCLSLLIFCTVSAIGISVKSHISTSLLKTAVLFTGLGLNSTAKMQRCLYSHYDCSITQL